MTAEDAGAPGAASGPGDLDIGAWYDHLAPRILALAVQLTGDRHLAEDVLQETFLSAHRARGGFRGEASPETWIHRIAIHSALQARRRRAHRRGLSGRPVAGGDDAARKVEAGRPDDRSARREDAQRLLEAMNHLSEEHHVVLSLLALREVPAAAIAEILAIPVGTVHSRAHAARRRLAEVLGRTADGHRAATSVPVERRRGAETPPGDRPGPSGLTQPWTTRPPAAGRRTR
jgi:RNA polymerase sigma-70 factor (ECF subfamily)